MFAPDRLPASMADCLTQFAAEKPAAVALTMFDKQGETPYTYDEIARRSRALAARLQQDTGLGSVVGERAMLMMDTSVDYVTAFFGCLYAGVVAVPIFPPESLREHHLRRLNVVAEDAGARWVLTSSDVVDSLADALHSISDARIIQVDQVAQTLADAYQPWTPARDDLAFLQYTSGSTSAPKGVMVSHGNLMANEAAIRQVGQMNDNDVFVSWLPLFHDMGLILGMLLPFYCGRPLVLMSPRFFLERPSRWLEAIDRHGGTVSGGPDFAYRMCVERIRKNQLHKWNLRSWRVAFSGSEPIRVETLDEFCELLQPCQFDPAAITASYGLAEGTLLVSTSTVSQGLQADPFSTAALARGEVQVQPGDGDRSLHVACGPVAPDHDVRIMDPRSGAAVANDQVGEIQVSGPSITLGYWRNSEATAAAFIEQDGQRWLRTGDMGFLHGGQLYISGRCKDLIIVRGHNLYPQDLEAGIESELDWVRRGRIAAFAVDLNGKEGIGLALEVSRSIRKRVPAEALYAQLNDWVSRHCMESVSVALLLEAGGLPKTSSGKLQRSACVTGWQQQSLDTFAIFAAGQRVDSDADAVAVAAPSHTLDAPLSKTEQRLISLWQQLLNVQRVTPEDNFFALGGDSVRLFQLAEQAHQQGITVTAEQLFASQTLAELARAIDSTDGQSELVPMTPIDAAERQQGVPLSSTQQRQWILHQLQPDSATYHIGARLPLQGLVDIDAIRTSFQSLVNRHESLRTLFHTASGNDPIEQVLQRVLPNATLDIPVMDLRGAADPSTALEAAAEGLLGQPFDINKGPLLRVALLQQSDERYQLVVVMHHIIADGWSMQLIIDEFVQLYRAHREQRTLELPALPLQYADYARWQRSQLSGDKLARQLAYWKNLLGEDHSPLLLATDHPRTATTDYQPQRHSFALPETLSRQLHERARSRGVTPFMILLAAFQGLLYRYSGKEQIRVGVPVANRHRRETQPMVGFFVNTQVLPTQLNDQTSLTALLDSTFSLLQDAQRNQDLPFDQLVDALQPERSLNYSPLFQVMYNHLRQDNRALQTLPGIVPGELELITANGQFELTLETLEGADGQLSACFSYASELFEPVTIARMAQHYQALLAAMVQGSDSPLAEVPLLDQAEQNRLQALGDNAQQFDLGSPVHQRVAQQSAARPDRIALQFEDQQLSYGELNRRANQLAHYLIALGVGPDLPVGIAAERSVEMVIGLLAILKAGGAYVPLDPDYPSERLAYMIEHSGIELILSQSWLADSLALQPHHQLIELDCLTLADQPAHNPIVALQPDNLAYVIYTSGSTGKPKGVMVRHAGLSNFLHSMQAMPGLDENDTLLAVTSLSFDIAALELYLPLVTGGRLLLASATERQDGQRLARLIDQQGVTVMQATPASWRMLLDLTLTDTSRWAFPENLRAFCGGEALPVDLADGVRRAGVELWNLYGPTETTIWSALERVNDSRVSLGRAVASTQLYVVDSQLNPVPQGVPGELLIGGEGLTRGYFQRADLTAERFIANPFSKTGTRLYRTGDLVRWRADGQLEYLQRLDNQIKIRGFRIELGEIENALNSHPQVRQGAVVARDNGQHSFLAAFIELRDGQPLTLDALRQSLGQQLPDYMLPTALQVMAALPLTPNGKVDRKALPIIDAVVQVEYQPPQGPVETLLADIWQQVLNVEQVGRQDNVFALGGNSLNLTQINSRVQQQLGQNIPLSRFFALPVLCDLADWISHICTEVSTAIPAIRCRPVGAPAPLSYAQQRQWFLWQLDPASSAYHISAGLRMQGRLDHRALSDSFDALIARHESLRTRFVDVGVGEVAQQVLPQLELEIPCFDLRGQRDAEQQALQLIDALARQPFDLRQGPLLRICRYQVADDVSLLGLVMHHIISDGWSAQVMVEEFSAQYSARLKGDTPTLVPLPIQYSDYALWQRQWMEAGEQSRQLAWWQAQLGDEHPVLALPTDHPRQPQPDYTAAIHRIELPGSLTDGLKKLARERGMTPFMVLLAGFHGLLHRYSGQADIRVGVPVANRNRVEVEALIGFFVNTQVLPVHFTADSRLDELLGAVKTIAEGAQSYQDLPFDILVDALNLDRSLSLNPLFQVMYNHLGFQHEQLQQLPGLAVEPLDLHEAGAQFELTLDTVDTADGGLAATFTYARELFEPATIERMAGHYQALLSAMVRDTGQRLAEVMLLNNAEQQQLQVWGHNDQTCPTDEQVHRLFEQQVASAPERLALLFDDQQLSYGGLNRRANQLAHYLIAQGVGPDVRVGMAVERSVEMIVSLLAVLKAGGAYVPLDPEYPPERLGHMIDQSGIQLILSQSSLRDDLPLAEGQQLIALDEIDLGSQPTHNPDVALHGDNLAYVIYTSGSTGKPKGVGIPHHALARHSRVSMDFFNLTADDRMLQFATVNFDGFVEQLYPPLCCGAAVILRGPMLWDSDTFYRHLLEDRITVVDLTTAYWYLIIQEFAQRGYRDYGALRQLHAGGEAMPPEGLQIWREAGLSHVTLLNTYGPTEATVTATELDCQPWVEGSRALPGQMPIGKPLGERQLYVLDGQLNPVPQGVAGELYIGGDLLARGYIDQPALSAERFIANPFNTEGGRMYRTGDLVRWLDGGELEYLGRTDHQVKIRGLRIELGEIEAALLAHVDVGNAIVMARQNDRSTQLVAWVVAEAGRELQSMALKTELGEQLPDYMVPGAIMVLEAMPLTPGGKVDRDALPAPEFSTGRDYIAPQGEMEQALAEIWQAVLNVEQVSRFDNFFELGGHSLSLMQVKSRIHQQLELEVPLNQLFATPELCEIAQLIDTGRETAAQEDAFELDEMSALLDGLE